MFDRSLSRKPLKAVRNMESLLTVLGKGSFYKGLGIKKV